MLSVLGVGAGVLAAGFLWRVGCHLADKIFPEPGEVTDAVGFRVEQDEDTED